MPVLISTTFVDQFQRFKAPRHMMYKISSIHFSVAIALAANQILVFSRELTPTGIPDDFTTSRDSVIAVKSTEAIGDFQVMDINEKAKIITVGKDNSGVTNAIVTIYGELIRATKVELIIEWFRKR